MDSLTSAKGALVLERALELFGGLTAAGTARDVLEVAQEIGLPGSTARRLVTVLERHGLLRRVAPGRYIAGERLVALAAARPAHAILAEAARPIARRLARRLDSSVHVGVFEQDMVTYVVCERSPGADELFTREGMQLEAYCTAIGKVLLSNLSDMRRERYLANGPFVALTPATITDPAMLAAQLVEARRSDQALENGETASDLACLAVPIRDGAGDAVGAISSAWHPSRGRPRNADGALTRAAAAIAARLARQQC